MTVVVDLTGMPGNIVGDLGLKGCGEHLPGAVADDLVEQRAARADYLAGLVGVVVLVHYREHGRAFPPALARWT
ncbi:MAG: hypothetical protein WBD41_01425 [Rhodococcus sp. (in: high G+C Gram-positive bacteria)]